MLSVVLCGETDVNIVDVTYLIIPVKRKKLTCIMEGITVVCWNDIWMESMTVIVNAITVYVYYLASLC